MVALPIYAKVNKLEKLQNDLAQIATYGIYAQRDMGHLDIDIPESHLYFEWYAQ
jgi:hypothetical protein